jgi:hypothetical protein
MSCCIELSFLCIIQPDCCKEQMVAQRKYVEVDYCKRMEKWQRWLAPWVLNPRLYPSPFLMGGGEVPFELEIIGISDNMLIKQSHSSSNMQPKSSSRSTCSSYMNNTILSPQILSF